MLLESARTDGIKETEGTKTVDVACVFGHFERNLDVRLSTKVVDFSRLDLGKDVYEVGAVAQVTVVELKFVRP